MLAVLIREANVLYLSQRLIMCVVIDESEFVPVHAMIGVC